MLVNDSEVLYISFNKDARITKITNNIKKIHKKSKHLLIKKVTDEESILFRAIGTEDMIFFLASESANTTINGMDIAVEEGSFEELCDNILSSFITYYEGFDYDTLLKMFLYENFKTDIDVDDLNKQIKEIIESKRKRK